MDEFVTFKAVKISTQIKKMKNSINNTSYSIGVLVGAVLIILGALFKILHYEYATLLMGTGLVVEFTGLILLIINKSKRVPSK